MISETSDISGIVLYEEDLEHLATAVEAADYDKRRDG